MLSQFLQPKWLAATAIVLVILTTVLVYLFRNFSYVDAKELFAGRDFRASPFVLTDAITLCQAEMQARYGEEVITSYIDEFSTRWEPRSGEYFVVMRAQLGSYNDHEQTMLYCDINPRTVELTHFKKQSIDERSFMERAGKLFK